MPSLKTKLLYQQIVVAQAEQALADAAAEVAEATQALEDLQDGVLNVSAINVGGTRFINDGGTLVAEP